MLQRISEASFWFFILSFCTDCFLLASVLVCISFFMLCKTFNKNYIYIKEKKQINDLSIKQSPLFPCRGLGTEKRHSYGVCFHAARGYVKSSFLENTYLSIYCAENQRREGRLMLLCCWNKIGNNFTLYSLKFSVGYVLNWYFLLMPSQLDV